MSEVVLALDLGGTTVKGELVTTLSVPGGGRVLATAKAPTRHGTADDVLDGVVALARELLERPGGDAVTRVGLAVPGLVDAAAGVGRYSVNLGWRDAPVAARVAQALRLPVVVTHDVTAAGVAEHEVGAGRGVDDLAVVVLGTGVAAVLFAAGRLLRGGAGQAGELGHVVVSPDGPPCPCGRRGCLETLASAASIARRYRELTGRCVAGAVDVRRLLGTDPAADEVWADAVDALAVALLAVSALLSPTRVVLGGGLAQAGEALLSPLAAALRTKATVETVPEVRLADLGRRAGIVGAALAAADPEAAGTAVHLP